MSTAPRIDPLEPPFSPAAEELLGKLMPRGTSLPPIALFRLLARHPDLAEAMRGVGRLLLAHGKLAPRDRELAILRTTARAGCEYEWGVHVAWVARAVGLDEAAVASTVAGPATSDADRALLAFVDAVADGGDVDDATWGAVARDRGDDAVLELVFLVGWYGAIARIARAARLPLEPWATRFPG